MGVVGLLLAAACGGGSRSTESGFAADVSGVEVTGHAQQRGTRGSVLVFAYADPGAANDPSTQEPVSVGTVSPDGSFELRVPPSAALVLVFLADGASDGVVDQGDPIAVLTAPELVDLQPGDRVQIGDAAIDFTSHRVAARVEVTRSGEPARTPTPVP